MKRNQIKNFRKGIYEIKKKSFYGASTSNHKNIVLIFSLIRTTFFYFFCFNISKMVDGGYDAKRNMNF